MENNLINIDFEKFTEEQLVIFEKKSREYREKTIKERVGALERWKKQTVVEMKLIRDDFKNLVETNNGLIEQVDVMEVKTAKITDTLLTHGIEKTKLENKIHAIVYKELEKGSLRDQLFHGLLTAKCKRHITKSLGVSSFVWIQVKDLRTAEKLVNVFLNKTTMHNEMQNKAQELHNTYQMVTGKKANDRDIRRKGLLEALVEECEGNISTI